MITVSNYVTEVQIASRYAWKEKVFKHLEEDFWKRFDSSNYEIDRPLPISQKMKIGLMRDELGT